MNRQLVKGQMLKLLAFVPLKLADGKIVYGAGIDSNIDQAAVRAIISGLNRVKLGIIL